MPSLARYRYIYDGRAWNITYWSPLQGCTYTSYPYLGQLSSGGRPRAKRSAQTVGFPINSGISHGRGERPHLEYPNSDATWLGCYARPDRDTAHSRCPRIIHRRAADAPLNNDCVTTAILCSTIFLGIPRKQALALFAFMQRARVDGLGAVGCVSGRRWREGRRRRRLRTGGDVVV